MTLDDIISLAEAAADLGLAQSTLRNQATAGRIRARLVGKTWITTRQEVERYRAESLGKLGRPRKTPEAEPARRSKTTTPWSVVKAERHARDADGKPDGG